MRIRWLSSWLALAVPLAAQAPTRPALVGLDHVAFKISNADAAQRFYGELLGYPVVQPRMAGAPQLVVPHLMDQFYWGRRVNLLGLGPPPLPKRRLQADRLVASLSVMLDNEALAERAREIGERLRDEAQSIDPVAALLS